MEAVRWIRSNVGPLAFVTALVLAVGLLPPDTSLREVERAGVLRACVPTSYPPLVTGDPARPGIDVEVLRAVAAELGVRLSLNENLVDRPRLQPPQLAADARELRSHRGRRRRCTADPVVPVDRPGLSRDGLGRDLRRPG